MQVHQQKSDGKSRNIPGPDATAGEQSSPSSASGMWKHPFKSLSELPRYARLLLPYWPHSTAAQELTMFRMNGANSRKILEKMQDEERAAANDQRHARRSGPSRVQRRQPLDAQDGTPRASIQPSSRGGHTSSFDTAAGSSQEEVQVQLPDGSGRSKRRKSSIQGDRRLESEHTAEGIDGLDCADRPRDEEDDGIERPNVSSQTFRVSRLVDEAFRRRSSDDDDRDSACSCSECGDGHQDARQLTTNDINVERHDTWQKMGKYDCAMTGYELAAPTVRFSARSHEQLEQLRRYIRGRVQTQHTLNARLRRGGLTNAAVPAASNPSDPSTAAVATAKSAKSSKAAKRAMAIKGGSAGQRVSLAEIKARNRARAQSQVQEDDGDGDSAKENRPIGYVPSSARKGSEGADLKAAISRPVIPPTGDFSFTHASPVTKTLALARRQLKALFERPLSEVMASLCLPLPPSGVDVDHADDEHHSRLSFVMDPAKVPMLHPWADKPVAKLTQKSTTSPEWPRLAQGMSFGDRAAQSDGAPAHHESLDAASPSPPSLKPIPSATHPPTSPQSPASSKRAMSRRKKANMNNIHHQFNASLWSASRSPSQSASLSPPPRDIPSASAPGSLLDGTAPGLEHPTTSSWLFPDAHICLFCDYELFYGERPRMIKACAHRRQNVRKGKKKAAPSSGGGERTSTQPDSVTGSFKESERPSAEKHRPLTTNRPARQHGQHGHHGASSAAETDPDCHESDGDGCCCDCGRPLEDRDYQDEK